MSLTNINSLAELMRQKINALIPSTSYSINEITEIKDIQKFFKVIARPQDGADANTLIVLQISFTKNNFRVVGHIYFSANVDRERVRIIAMGTVPLDVSTSTVYMNTPPSYVVETIRNVFAINRKQNYASKALGVNLDSEEAIDSLLDSIKL